MVSKNTWRNAFVILIIVMFVGAYYADKQKSPDYAYTRGWEQGFEEGRGQKDYGFALGYIQGGFDDIAGFDYRLGAEGSLVLAWEKDMVSLFLHEPYYDELKQYIDGLTLIYHLRTEADSMAMLLDSTKSYMTMEITRNSGLETVVQIIEGDTLYFHKRKVDTGYILIPIYRMRKLWTPEDSADSVDWWKDWLDTSKGWYGREISEPAVETSEYLSPEDCVDTWLNRLPEEERGLITTELLHIVEEWCNEIRHGAMPAVDSATKKEE